MPWYDPPVIPTYSHLLGLASASFVNSAGVTGGATGGRTVLGNVVSQQAGSSGTVGRVAIGINSCDGVGHWKAKVFRKNGSVYDLVGESESFVIANGTTTLTRDLSTHITGVQSGDRVGVWIADGNNGVAVTTDTNTAGVLYNDGDLTGAGNSFASSFNNFSLNVEGLAASGTAATTAHWAGTPSSGWASSAQISDGGTGRTFISGVVTERCLQHGTLTTVKMSFAAAGTGSCWKAKVFRPNGSNYDLVGESEFFAAPGTGTQTKTLGTPITGCQPGDVLGFYMSTAGGPQLNVTSITGAGAIRYTGSDVAGTNQAIASTLDNFSLNMEGLGLNPFLAVTGDSIAVGHASSSGYLSYFDGTGPSGTLAHDGGNCVRAASGNVLTYQNLAKGSQDYTWVDGTAFPGTIGVLACSPLAIWIHCGVNDIAGAVSQAAAWSEISTKLDSIRAQLATLHTSSTSTRGSTGAAPHIFLTEVLPDSGFTDTQAGWVRGINSSLATYCTTNSADVTLVAAHDAFGTTRVSTGQLDDLNSSYSDGSGLHLNQTGQTLLGTLVYNALLAYYGPASWPPVFQQRWRYLAKRRAS